MPINKNLLAILADGSWHSGVTLACVLGLSRTSVWKEIKKLSSVGLTINSAPGVGYRLSTQIELLDKNLLLGGLSAAALHAIPLIEILDDVDSTNAMALVKLRAGTPSNFALLAETQSTGKGRNGRHWHSPFAENIYLSLTWRFDGGLAVLEGLSLAIGVAVVRALKAQCRDDVFMLKWPNDIFFNDKKLGGILIELIGDISGVCDVVIGIGINVAMNSVPKQTVCGSWTSLVRENIHISRNLLAASVINESVNVLNEFAEKGFAVFCNEWNTLSVFHDRNVVVATPERRSIGRMLHVTNSGMLRIDCAGDVIEFSGGDVSLSADR